MSALTTMTWSPVSMWGAKVGLCLPRRMRATSVARRPRTRPSASTTYQAALDLAGFRGVRAHAVVLAELARLCSGGAARRPLEQRVRIRPGQPWRQMAGLRFPAWRIGPHLVTPGRHRRRPDEARRRHPADAGRASGHAVQRCAGATVLLKPEHRQRTGSFKIRGAYNLISQPAGRRDRVVAASAGNHAQGVALAAVAHRSPVDDLHARAARRCRRSRRPGPTAPTSVLGHAVVDDCIAAAQAFAAETGAPVRARRSTTRSSSPARAPSAWSSPSEAPERRGRARAGRRRRADRRRRGRAGRRPARRAGRSASRPRARRRCRRRSPPGARSRSTESHTIADGIAVKSPSALTLAHVAGVRATTSSP